MKTFKFLSLALIVTLGFSSCEKDDDLSLSDNIDESYFVEVEMDGKTLVLREGKDGYLSGGQAMQGSGDGSCSEGSGMVITKSQDQKKSFWVSLNRTAVNCAQDWSYESGLYQVGSYAFSSWPTWDKAEAEAQKNQIKVSIMYTDPNGVHWSSNRSSGEQTDSHFEIVSHRSIKDKRYHYATEMRFNCMLYNDEGEEMVITNGRMKSRSVAKHPSFSK